MVTSRCGVRCDACERKEAVQCQGCLSMEKPFWGGTCLVKTCCEERHLLHCGLCEDFPCSILQNMGKEQGYDSHEKIEQCRQWKTETEK